MCIVEVSAYGNKSALAELILSSLLLLVLDLFLSIACSFIKLIAFKTYCVRALSFICCCIPVANKII